MILEYLPQKKTNFDMLWVRIECNVTIEVIQLMGVEILSDPFRMFAVKS